MHNLACLDFDPRGTRGGEPVGPFLEEFGNLLMSRVYRERTPSGGAHLVARASPGVDRQWNGWRDGIDLKAGRSFIVVAPSPGYEFTGGIRSLRPDDLREWPEHIVEALRARPAARAGSPTAAPEDWSCVAEVSRPYRAHWVIEEAMEVDCARLAATPPGRQNWTLNRLGWIWGRKVRQRSCSATFALYWLTRAAMRMENSDASYPWDRADVRARLQRAILEGHSSGSCGPDPCAPAGPRPQRLGLGTVPQPDQSRGRAGA